MKHISDNTNSHKKDTYSLTELCRELSISVATGRNWLRLGKLVPDCIVTGHIEEKTGYFSKKYVQKLKGDIQSGRNKALKSRRNKKYVSGNTLYNSYVSEDSVNASIVQMLLQIIEEEHIALTDNLLRAIMAECAVRLLVQRMDKVVVKASKNRKEAKLLKQFIKGDISFGVCDILLNELLEGVEKLQELIEEHPSLFELSYVYEEREDILGLIYISCRGMEQRKASGAYYTPTRVVRQLIDNMNGCGEAGKKIMDPCCGTGNFLLQLPASFAMKDIYGNDLDDISVKITRINMALKYKIQDSEDIQVLHANITCDNFLISEKNTTDNKKYDYIVGNPPWGYDFSEGEYGLLREKYRSAVGKNIESYDVFVEEALSRLKADGRLMFVLPEAVLNVKSHMAIREVIRGQCSIEYLAFLGNVFHKVLCPSIILGICHTGSEMSTEGMRVQDGDRSYTITAYREVTCRNFNFRTTDEEYRSIQRMKNVSDAVYLKDNAIFALGIVTGHNEEYITHEKSKENEIILKGMDIEKYHINHTDNYILCKPESFQQMAPLEIYRAPEKLVYRFIGDKLVFAYDDKQRLTLNSCNILIPQIENMDMKYILAVLNSSAVQFFYEKEFGSVKVLRSHIEQIPIPRVSGEKQREVVKLVDTLIEYRQNPHKYADTDTVKKMMLRIDEMIAELYGLR